MPPTLGGANQTFEDVWVPGRELARDGDAPAVRLRAYEKTRYPHVNLVSRSTPAESSLTKMSRNLFLVSGAQT